MSIKKIWKYMDKPLFFLTIFLFAVGLIMIFSSSNVIAYMQNKASPSRYFMKQSIFLAISFIAAFILMQVKTKNYEPFSVIGIIGIIGMLIYVLIYGPMQNQAVSWIDLGFFSIQPAEFAKVIMIVFMACYYERKKDHLDKYMTSLLPIGIGIIIAALIFVQPDLGTMLIFSFIVFYLFLASPVSKKIKTNILLLCGGMLIVGMVAIFASGGTLLLDRQLERLNFFDPCSRYTDQRGTGYQVCNSYIAINNGGLFGVGLGNSTQKYLYLPEAHTDAIFAVIMEELGLILSAGIIVLYFFVIGRIIKIGKCSYTIRGAMMCYGVSAYIFIHIIVNLTGLFGLLPLTGVPLPFMSYGGSFAMCLVLALALVQRVNIETKMEELKQKNSKNKKK